MSSVRYNGSDRFSIFNSGRDISSCSPSIGFGNALHCDINWRCSDAAGRGARVFAPSIGCSGCLWRGKYRSRGRWRGGRPRIPLETRQLIREMARANFLWGAPRIHGELLKLGITVSQATVSRYMPTSRKDRRSPAWRTFIRNHAITIVQSHSFNSHNWARDRASSRITFQHLSLYRSRVHRVWLFGIRSIHSLLP